MEKECANIVTEECLSKVEDKCGSKAGRDVEARPLKLDERGPPVDSMNNEFCRA